MSSIARLQAASHTSGFDVADTRIKADRRLPFDPSSRISAGTQQFLTQHARQLIDTYGQAHGTWNRGQGLVPTLNYRDIGGILKDIAADSSLDEDEKAFVWNLIATSKLRPDDNFYPHPTAYRTSNDGARPLVLDNFDRNDSPTHAFVPLNDGHHGPMAMLATLDEAHERILAAEQGEGGFVGAAVRRVGQAFGGPPLNYGDFNASDYTVQAMRAYRQGGFTAFADTWNRLFLGQ